MQRKMEGLLLAAEVFDAAASSLGGKSQAELLDKAWKDMLTSQSHDVGLCEYSRWQGDRFAPAERLEDRHNFPWGVIGYNLLDAAQKECQQALDATLADLGRRIGSAAAPTAPMAVTVLNPHCWPRTDVAATGRIYPLPAGDQGRRRQGPRRQGRPFADRAKFQGPDQRQPHRRGSRLPGPARCPAPATTRITWTSPAKRPRRWRPI